MTGKTIQIVEDDGLIALHLAQMLEKAGYRINDVVCSGEMALHALETPPPPDLILMDIGLAGSLDGIETARMIRQKYSIPLIFATSYSTDKMLERMLEVAPDGVIFKPYNERDLLDKIENVIM
jgi:CheY-like chemotaxis protein